jgi:hypothetical protein
MTDDRVGSPEGRCRPPGGVRPRRAPQRPDSPRRRWRGAASPRCQAGGGTAVGAAAGDHDEEVPSPVRAGGRTITTPKVGRSGADGGTPALRPAGRGSSWAFRRRAGRIRQRSLRWCWPHEPRAVVTTARAVTATEITAHHEVPTTVADRRRQLRRRCPSLAAGAGSMAHGATARTPGGSWTPESEKSQAGRVRNPRSVRIRALSRRTPAALGGGGAPACPASRESTVLRASRELLEGNRQRAPVQRLGK